MKFNANSKSLEKLLSKVFPAIPTRTPVPVLENFLFEIEDGKLSVSATDLDLALKSTTTINSNQNARFIIPAKLLYEIVKSLGDTSIDFETEENNKLKMKTDFGVYSIGYNIADDYPKITSLHGGNSFSIAGEELKKILSRTTFAVSKESVRPAMMGILFEFIADAFRVVSTDGHRLVRYTTTTDHTLGEMQRVIPEKAVTVLGKLLSDEKINITFSDSVATFNIDDTEMTTKLINQKYPDYNSVIPQANESVLVVNKDELLSAVKRMLLFSTSTYHQVKLSLTLGNIEISAEDLDHGSSAKETIMCDYKGEQMDIGFNTLFLFDMLSHLDSKEALFKINNPTKAVTIEPTEQEASVDILMLIMPVRVNN